MTVELEASNLLATPLLNVGSLLANCAMFRTLMDASTVAAAKARQIYIESDECESDQASLPRCIIGYSPYEFGTELIGTTNWVTNGPVEARIEVATDEAYLFDKQDEVKWWTNSIGTLFSQIRTLATTGGGYLNVVNLKLGMCGRLDATEFNGTRGMGVALIFEWRGP